jgi:hypothetical protein
MMAITGIVEDPVVVYPAKGTLTISNPNPKIPTHAVALLNWFPFSIIPEIIIPDNQTNGIPRYRAAVPSVNAMNDCPAARIMLLSVSEVAASNCLERDKSQKAVLVAI